MLSKESQDIFQDFMPGNLCFGCGRNTKDGLHIKSFWRGDYSECIWTPSDKHQGWPNIMNGGIIATIIDCHAMGTSMAYAYKYEKRPLGSLPEYRYATGSIKVKYIKPTLNQEVKLRAKVLSYSEKRVVINCKVISSGQVTAVGDVIAFRVFDSSNKKNNLFQV